MHELWAKIREWLIARCPLLLIPACIAITVAFATPRISPPAPPESAQKGITLSDTVGPPRTIYNYSESQLGAMRAVIKTPAEFDRLWQILRRDPSELAPKVDFSKDMLIVAGMGWEPDGGYRIAIPSVRDTAGLLDVTVDLTIATAKCTGGYAAVDHPTVVVAVPKSRSIAVFHDRVHRSC